jgi:16S rRNA (cytosine967-C5)-methyltransferase
VSRAGSQVRTLSGLLGALAPHWRRDAALPARVDSLLRGDRRLGSRDRRLYRELAYTAVRYLPWVEPLVGADPEQAARRIAWLAADTEEVLPFRAEVARGLPPCPPGADAKAGILGEDVDALSPPWLAAECPGALAPPLRECLLSRAPLWIRLQGPASGDALREFERRGVPWQQSDRLAGAVRLPADARVDAMDAYKAGLFEVQDLGSQLVLGSAAPAPSGRWLDACAGAGGKSLQLAALLGPGGGVVARDARPQALAELRRRAARAGLSDRIAAGDPADPPGGFDGVLVDAPCTGSGTWRRAPHLRWVTTPAGIGAAARLQLGLLLENAPRVRPGGLLVYATCSLCRSENERVAEEFLSRGPGMEPAAPPVRLLPWEHDGDGFFVAAFRRP